MRSLLRYAVSLLSSIPAVEKKLGVQRGYLGKLFAGTIELKLDRILEIGAALDLEPAELFRLAYPITPRRTPAGEHLREMWSRLKGDSGPVALPPPLLHEAADPWRLMELQKDLEARVNGALFRWIYNLTRDVPAGPDQGADEEGEK